MPTYAYRCANSHAWEERRKLGDHDVTCPECGAQGFHVFSPVPFKFSLRKRGYSAETPEGEEAVYTRTYAPGQEIGDPMLDDGFVRER